MMENLIQAEQSVSELPMDWDIVFDSGIPEQETQTQHIPDALVHCLTTLGRVDIDYIAALTGTDCKTVIAALKGAIYQNPLTWNGSFYEGWETADEYLSGNLIKKRQEARAANAKFSGLFADNIKAIDAVLPPAVAADDIYVTLGSPWLPADLIDEFIRTVFGKPRIRVWDAEALCTVHDELTGTWEIPYKSRYRHSARVRNTYGTDRLEALHILEQTLNMKTVSVTDEIPCADNKSGKKRVINETETAAALDRQQKLIAKFQKWVWDDPKRKARLEQIYSERYGSVRRRIFDGSFLVFPGMSPAIRLYPYQKNAAARIIFTPNTLLAHDVGAGKTYIMIAAGQELRRMELSQKNLYVVPNNLVGQWQQIFREMYPDARLLCVEPKCFSPARRNDTLAQIRDEDFDGIIMAYSCFSQIPISAESRADAIREQIGQIQQQLKNPRKRSPGLKRALAELEKSLMKLEFERLGPKPEICFDELGITRMFVDEAHNFKNVPIQTKTDKVLGISSAGSKKCQDMMDKVHLIQRQNNGKGVTLATGTPITNSVTDVYVMQRYLQSGELAMLDLLSFDSWIGMFAERVTEFEIDVDTSSYRLATRFAKFHNLPELTALLASVADFHEADKSAGIPDFDGYHDALIPKTPEFAAYLGEIAKRADNVRHGRVRRTEDNLLTITGDGRKAALDLRLVQQDQPFTLQSKVARCAENVTEIFFRTAENRSTQLVFCDVSTPKAGFNLYTELKRLLMEKEIESEQIAFIHDADTEKKHSALFAKMRRGDVRILIGSTFKLGLGVNIQERLIALHHLDVPWRPADMTQREGRILRQGNTNSKVFIYRYITEGSFDAYSWQLLETKQRFINDLLSGSLTARSGSDVEDTVLNYAEVKALAIGNPLVKKRVEAANELSRYQMLQRKAIESRTRLEQELAGLPEQIRQQQKNVRKCEDDAAFYAEQQVQEQSALTKEQTAAARRALRELLADALKHHEDQPEEKELYTLCGFRIVLPAHMTRERPYVWLRRSGAYYVGLGGNETGNLIRIENRLNSLNEHLAHLRAELTRLKEKQADLQAELAQAETYSEQIALYAEKVARLDKKLGVNKK